MLEIRTNNGLRLQIPQFTSVNIPNTDEKVTDISELILNPDFTYVFIGDNMVSIKGSDILVLSFT